MISEEKISRHAILRKVPRSKLRIYVAEESCVFWFTARENGEFSNMADGFPLHVGGIVFTGSEALYQACKFPEYPHVQEKIIEAPSAKMAKKISRDNAGLVREDWLKVRVDVMRWVIRVKGLQYKKDFLFSLIQTEDKAIVEQSSKDAFWGAIRVEEFMIGMNVLGRLLMELRAQVREDSIDLMRLPTPESIGVRMLGQVVPFVVPAR